MVKNLPAMQETGFNPSVGKIPWRRKWPPIPVFLPGEFHGQRILAGHSLTHAQLGLGLGLEIIGLGVTRVRHDLATKPPATMLRQFGSS